MAALARIEGGGSIGDLRCDGTRIYPFLRLREEISRSDLNWLYLAMVCIHSGISGRAMNTDDVKVKGSKKKL